MEDNMYSKILSLLDKLGLRLLYSVKVEHEQGIVTSSVPVLTVLDTNGTVLGTLIGNSEAKGFLNGLEASLGTKDSMDGFQKGFMLGHKLVNREKKGLGQSASRK